MGSLECQADVLQATTLSCGQKNCPYFLLPVLDSGSSHKMLSSLPRDVPTSSPSVGKGREGYSRRECMVGFLIQILWPTSSLLYTFSSDPHLSLPRSETERKISGWMKAGTPCQSTARGTSSMSLMNGLTLFVNLEM